jgi:hypothetical protein
MRTMTANLKTWSATLNCFRGEAGDRLETTAASGVVEELGAMHRRVGILGRVVYRRNLVAVSRFSGERFLPDSSVYGLGSRGRRERVV